MNEVVAVEVFAANGVWYGETIDSDNWGRQWRMPSKRSLQRAVEESFRVWPGIAVDVELRPMTASKAIERGCQWAA
jgi:hypothetical protein